jgi:hypothetical protein
LIKLLIAEQCSNRELHLLERLERDSFRFDFIRFDDGNVVRGLRGVRVVLLERERAKEQASDGAVDGRAKRHHFASSARHHEHSRALDQSESAGE